MAHDVIAAGPVLVGAGAGYAVQLSRSWRFIADANLIGAIAIGDSYQGVGHEHALHLELDVGFAVSR